jgi:tRNA(Ile)-lysidine synthase TilS/MesJ
LKISKEKRKLNSKIIKIIPERKEKPFVSVLKSPFAKNFISKFKNVLTKELFVEPNSKILVAVSGGVDSVSLLDAFVILQKHLSFRIAIAHLNHQLRGEEANRDEEFVKGLTEKY